MNFWLIEGGSFLFLAGAVVLYLLWRRYCRRRALRRRLAQIAGDLDQKRQPEDQE